MVDPIDCFYAKNHALIWSDGSMTPCCNYKDGEDPIGHHTDVFEFFNSLEMIKLRQDHANGVKRPGCRKCWSVEDAGGVSYRKPSIPSHAGKLAGLDIALGRTCTLKCRTCGPFASSAWESELISRGIRRHRESLDIADIPLEAFDNIEQLDIQGGEPFLSKKFPDMLGYLASSGISKNISLTITTNAECFPDKSYTAPLPFFKNVLIKLSIDGVGIRNEYMRSGSDWTRTMDTVERWGHFKKDLDNMKLVVNHTISTFNFIYYEEIVAEVARLRSLSGLEALDLWCHHALENEWHNCFLLPSSLREEAKMIWSRGTPAVFEFQDFRRVMISMLNQDRSEPPLPFSEWWQNNQVMDRIRKQSIETALPELVSMFKRHGLFDSR